MKVGKRGGGKKREREKKREKSTVWDCVESCSLEVSLIHQTVQRTPGNVGTGTYKKPNSQLLRCARDSSTISSVICYGKMEDVNVFIRCILVSCHREIVSLQTHQINITVRDWKTLHCVRGRVAEKEGMGKVGGKG